MSYGLETKWVLNPKIWDGKPPQNHPFVLKGFFHEFFTIHFGGSIFFHIFGSTNIQMDGPGLKNLGSWGQVSGVNFFKAKEIDATQQKTED